MEYKIIYTYICPVCGGMDWNEIIHGCTYSYTTTEDGIAEVDVDCWGETAIQCPKCDIEIWNGEIAVDKKTLKKLVKMKPMERIIYVIELEAMGKGILVFPEDFIDSVLIHHEKNNELMEKIKPSLLTLNVKK